MDQKEVDQKEVFVEETIQLKEINLSGLPKLKHIWKQNFQELVNFRETAEAHIQHHRSACSIQRVHLPNLETIIIEAMPELKTIWHPFFTSSCLDNLKVMQVSNCEKLENIFPSYMQRAFASLETLTISDCNSVQVIFEFSSEMDSAEKTTHLQQLTLLRLIKLRQIWSRDPLANLSFHNLQSVRVENCEDLEYLFPFSIAKYASQLEDITIRNAGSMKHIVSKKEGILDGPFIFEFNRLASMVIWKLYELEGFFVGNHSVHCPLLRELDVRHCVRLKLFKTKITSGQERLDSKLQNSTRQSLFTLEEVICNLERLALNSEDVSMILQGQFSGEQFSKLEFLCLANFQDDHATFPYWFLQNITTLNELHVECSSFKEIFQGEIPIDDDKQFKIETRIEKLTLNQLYDLQHICKEGFQIDPILEDLKYLLVQHCSKLKHLLPSTVTCSQLKYLEVQNCNGLIHLITSSTAKSLVNLRRMMIRNCNSLEQVVVEDREESKDAIAFRWLWVLELECLPRLDMFCSSSHCLLELPWLYKVVISNCPRMEIFSLGKTDAPRLKKVVTHKEDEKQQWQGDLNTTVTKIFQDMSDQVVETTKQEIPNLPSSSDDRQQQEKGSSTDPQDAGLAKGTQEMGGNIESPMVETTKVTLNPIEVCNADKHGTIQTDQDMESLATTRNTEESHRLSFGIQEMCDNIKKPSISVAQNVPSSSSNMIPDAATMYPSPSQAPELATTQSPGKSCDSCIETQTAQKFSNYTMIPNAGLTKRTQEMGENIERPMVEAAKISPCLTGVYNAEGSHESETCPQENLFNQPKILVTCDNIEAVGSQEIRETMDKPLIQSDQHAQKLATTKNTEVNETIEKPLIQTSQHAQRPTTGQDIEESHESKTCPNEDSFNQPETFVTRDKEENIHDTMDKPLIQTDQDAEKLATIQNTEESRDSYTGTPKICNTIKQASISAAQDVSNSTMIPEAAIDPSPSQAPEPAISPTEKLNIYRNYKEMIDISKQNMPYLEAGVNRHPQVLDWLDTKRRRVFASSTFSLFAEVTCILRTTRKGHLTEDDRSYIIECCTVLEAAGFDVSWLSYVHKCIEECGDTEDMKRKVEETKGQASSLEAQIESMKKELASVKESLVLLLDKARTLDDFIES